jgi:nucleotide-binding universal stress UspA family protein
MFTTVLIPVDGSEHAHKAVEVGSNLAVLFNARVIVLHVMEEIGSSRVPDGLTELEHIEHMHITESDVLMAVGKAVVDRAAARCRELGAKQVEEQVTLGNPRREIARLAKDNGADLIVMGRRGLGRFADLVLGSVSHQVTQGADCACLTVK